MSATRFFQMTFTLIDGVTLMDVYPHDDSEVAFAAMVEKRTKFEVETAPLQSVVVCEVFG